MTIQTRRMDFSDRISTIPRNFASNDDLINKHLAVVLSGMFPDGEDFFVRSVRRFRNQITDPELKKQVAGFIGQESVHGKQHRLLNRHFDALGYGTAGTEKRTKKFFELREKIVSPLSCLAATAALEHFTATLAQLLMTDYRVRDLFGDEDALYLFLWHALEESEHKAVAFDVYRHVGGTEKLRILTMKTVKFGFIVGVILEMILSLVRDPDTYRRGYLFQSLRRFFRGPIMSREVREQLRDYNRVGFHPNDSDTAALTEFWREALFGETGVLVGVVE